MKLHPIGFKCYLIHVLMKTVYTEHNFSSGIFIHQSHNLLKIILAQSAEGRCSLLVLINTNSPTVILRNWKFQK